MLIFRCLSPCICHLGWVSLVLIQRTGNYVPQDRISLNWLNISYPTSECWVGCLRYFTWNSVSPLGLRYLFLLHWETLSSCGCYRLAPFLWSHLSKLGAKRGWLCIFCNAVPSLKYCVVFYAGLWLHRKDREQPDGYTQLGYCFDFLQVNKTGL